MLKVAIIGCGKIADSHAAQISRIPNCQIVAVCDRELLMAKQLQERYGINRCYDDLNSLLDNEKPQVVHITTPPQSHYALARLCLEKGCHTYVEKPFALDTSHAVQLIELAQQLGLKITAGHDDQYSHVARRLREAVRSGYIGGPPVHLESYYGYELSGAYAKALLGDKQHWVRQLPGQLLHNIISHGIARVAEYISTPDPKVIAFGFTSPFLRDLGETQIVDEVRVVIADEGRTTAYFTFSSQMRPCLHVLRVYGTKNGLELNEDQQTLIKLKGKALPSYAEKFIPPVTLSRQYFSNLLGNARLFWKSDFHMKSGMKFLIEEFYRSILDGGPPPIPYREIILTSRIMDEIFRQINDRSSTVPEVPDLSRIIKGAYPANSVAEPAG